MILELDIGNTRAKWRLLSVGGQRVFCGDAAIADWLHSGLPREWSGGVRRVRAASVVGAEIEYKFAQYVQASLGLKVEFARANEACSGLRNAYTSPQSLGVDRWLALVAAYKQADAAVLVVDIGSALTVDLADCDGAHRGGYIIPGPRLMQGALLRDTERVRFPERESLGGLEFGRDTAGCVSGGIAAAEVGAVVVALQCAKAAVGNEVRVFITGGWGGALGECLNAVGLADFVLAPELVLDGLRWVLP